MPHALRLIAICLTVSASILAQEGGATPLTRETINRQATTPSGHRIEVAADGARILCQMQDLEGHLTRQGLTIRSVDDGEPGACSLRTRAIGRPGSEQAVGPGQVVVDGSSARLVRPGIVESITTTSDGIRQDWIIHSRPPGHGSLTLDLDLAGAAIRTIADDQLAMTVNGGRRLVWRNLAVFDANDQHLAAQFLIENDCLRIAVDDATATYPVRIDPTYTDADWTSMGMVPGYSFVFSIVPWRAGLVAGGIFRNENDSTYSNLLWWDGNSWTDKGFHFLGGEVSELASDGSNLYVGGYFSNIDDLEVKGVAKWDGSSWSNLGAGLNGIATALAIHEGMLYAGGYFTMAGDTSANHIARWNGSAWTPLGSGTNGLVEAITVKGSDVFIGGDFTTAGSVNANRIARWDGNAWNALGTGVDSTVLALATSGSTLYAGGRFSTAGGSNISCVAQWNGTTWERLGSGIPALNIVKCLTVSGNNLYVGGHFATAGGTIANSIARWDGGSWYPLGNGMDSYVYSIVASGAELLAGGSFTTAGGITAQSIARWNGVSWSPLGSGTGVNRTVSAIASSGSNLYLGGNFSTAGGIPVNYITKWNGSNWIPLGLGMNGPVNALALDGTNLYAGGNFTTAGGIPAHNIAMWDGWSWRTLGTGTDGEVKALALSGSTLFAGGKFITAGGGVAMHAAKWNGITWAALGSGLNAPVHTLSVTGPNLLAGGAFTQAGEKTVNHIAQWDGSGWSNLGGGTNGSVFALIHSGTNLFAGGSFFVAGDTAAMNIARWDGRNWNGLGVGTDAAVYALAISGSDLLAGGEFRQAGGLDASRIAHWDGLAWSAVGRGTNGPVRTLTNAGTGLYAGGSFTMAGDKVSAYLARLDLNSLTISFHPNGASSGMVPPAMSKLSGQNLVIPGNIGNLAKTGASFNGWNTAANGSGTFYAAGSTYAIDAAATMYAQWKPDTYPVTFIANGADSGVVPISQVKSHDVDLVISGNTGDLTRSDSDFDRWNTAADGRGTPYAAGAIYSLNAAMILYAQWTPKVYTVTYDANQASSGTAPADQIKVHGQTLLLSANTGNLLKNRATFSGWNTAANGTGTTYAAGGAYTMNVGTTLYAKWTALPDPASPPPNQASIPSWTPASGSSGGSSSGCGVGGVGVLLATAGLAVITARRRRR